MLIRFISLLRVKNKPESKRIPQGKTSVSKCLEKIRRGELAS